VEHNRVVRCIERRHRAFGFCHEAGRRSSLFPRRFKEFVTSLLEALSFSVILFGILGFPDSVVTLILSHLTSFMVVFGILTTMFFPFSNIVCFCL